MENWLNRELNVNLTKLTCLGLSPIMDNSWKTLSHILLLGRFLLYTCKLGRLILTIKIKLRNTQEIERQVATKNSDTQSFQQKWNNIMIPRGPLTHKFPHFQSDNSKNYYGCILYNHLWNVCLPFVSLLFFVFRVVTLMFSNIIFVKNNSVTIIYNIASMDEITNKKKILKKSFWW